ncbi:sulfur oxidation c-type cytochrome SoxA [Sulfuritalea sp.]|uniref:sulfur oxidation c-type cytochrome SoxA n=1 Tax=Sulfuritalea sp. TaxID=2480090 RepID=UPI00286E00A6|nr:sulfur oxidation c-type cytochrome SoxA [Sulfuritalea sp.]
MKQNLIGALCAVAVMGGAFAQTPKKPAAKPAAKMAPAVEEKDAATLEFEKFRAEMEESNPAELFEMKGQEQWKTKRGPKNVSLAESCDLGQGIGKVEGAYVKMPRYFADADAVMDAERRIVWCMVEKQGFKFDDIAAKPFANANFTPDITNLVTYVAGHSRNMRIAVPLKDPKVRAAYETGKAMAAYRAGPYDFSCNTCHGSDGKRIRMQNLPNLTTAAGAMKGVQGWPGYRMTGGVMLTHQWRMGDCFRQQRFPEPKYASDAIAYLLTYMIGNANGQVYKGPGIKR